MMDPAAIGTAIIGIEAIRAEDAGNGRPRSRPKTVVRRLLAAALLRAANALDPARPSVARVGQRESARPS